MRLFVNGDLEGIWRENHGIVQISYGLSYYTAQLNSMPYTLFPKTGSED
jgi:hypothetical protein